MNHDVYIHYEKTVLRPRFENAALGHKNAALGPFGLRPRFLRKRGLKRATIGPVSLRPHFLNRGPRPGPIAAVKTRRQTDQI